MYGINKQNDLSEWFIRLRRIASWLRKIVPTQYRHKFPSIGRFIPPSSNFQATDEYYLERHNTNFVINRSDYVQWRIFYGVRDNALLMAKKNITKNSLVLDIGANVGAFSLKLARHIFENNIEGVKIQAFEPNATVYDSLRKNCSLNPELHSMISVFNYGLGSENSEKNFDYKPSNTGAGRIVSKSAGKFKVQIKKLDELIHELKPAKISFIKLIVEGFEPEVLHGGWTTILNHRPPIFMEVTRSWWQENDADVEDVLAKLKSVNYSFLIEEYNELRPIRIPEDLSRDQFNLFAFPDTDASVNRAT